MPQVTSKLTPTAVIQAACESDRQRPNSITKYQKAKREGGGGALPTHLKTRLGVPIFGVALR